MRENGQHGETRVRQKEAGPSSHRKTWRNKWFWGRHSEFREGTWKLSECDGLEHLRARALELWVSGTQ